MRPMALPNDRYPAPIQEELFPMESPSTAYDGREPLPQLQFGVYEQYSEYQKKMPSSTAARGRRRASLSGAPTATDFRGARMERRSSASHDSSLPELTEELTPLSRSRKAYSETNLVSVGHGSAAPQGWPAYDGATAHPHSMDDLRLREHGAASGEFFHGQLPTKGSKIHSSTPDVNLLFSLFSVLEQPGEEGSAASPGGEALASVAGQGGVYGAAAGSSIQRPSSAMNPLINNLIVQGTASPVTKTFPPLLNDVQLMQYSAMGGGGGSTGMSPMSEGFPQQQLPPHAAQQQQQQQQQQLQQPSQFPHPHHQRHQNTLRHRALAAPTINTSLLPSHPFAPMLHGTGLDPLGSGMMLMSPMSPHTHHQMVAAQMMQDDLLGGTPNMSVVTPTFGLFSPIGASGQPPSAGFSEQTSLLNELVERLS